MVSAWWAAGVVAVPAVVLRALGRGGKAKPDADAGASRADDGGDPSFVCERVCTSSRLMRRMGGLSKDPTLDSCVTVCGTSAPDACTDACRRTVCANVHQVPAWNEACISRCSNECQRGRAA